MNSYTRVFATIDLDAVDFNMRSMQKNLRSGTNMIGVVKTDGYGHGAVPIAKTIDPYVNGYAVATIEEALNLRTHRITKPILVLGVTHPSHAQDLIEQEIRPAVFTVAQARPLSELASHCGKKAKIHLAVDTGMGRIGMSPDAEGVKIACEIASLPGIEIEGMFTHFAKADETDKSYAERQQERYLRFLSLLKEQGIKIPVLHIANSAAIIDLPQAHLHTVRAGISIYGLYPSDEVEQKRVPLKPAMGLKSFVTYVKKVSAGTPISYGCTFVTETESRIATVPVGYGDGYPRGMSNRGYVLIGGKKAPIRGRVCMDQFMVDVTEIPDVEVGSEVTLMGRDGEEQITAEEIARISGRFHYELVCDIGKRVPRVYLRGGLIAGRKDYFRDRYEDFMD
ncbi:MAG: alanine racemase [Clostridiales bacterium]|nr:alanine racemase [Clostridiales bacterium]